MDYMDYEGLLKDLDICSKAMSCLGCTQEDNQKGVPDCYRIIMEQAADTIRELLLERKRMIDRDELVKELGIQIRKTMTDSKGYIDGMVAASNIAVLMPGAGEEKP